MLGLGLGFGKLSSYKYTVKKLIDDYIKRVTAAGGYLEGNECATAKVRELNSQRLLDDASWLLIPEGIKEDVVYAQKPTSGLGDLVFTRASDATRTNSAGVIERTPWNLVQFSEMFSDAYWAKEKAGVALIPVVTANVELAPNGTMTADRIVFDLNGGTTSSDLSQLASGAFTYTSETRTQSIYLRTTDGTTKVFSFVSPSGGVSQITVTSTYQRFTFTTTGAGGSTIRLRLRGAGEGTATSATVAAWGAQFVEGTDAKPYFATTNRQDVPRLDYRNADGSLNSCPRLLLEPQRTNSIRNSTMVGAVAGSPGTLPTNYTASSGTLGLTRTIIGTGTESGLTYLDVRFNGTASSTGNTRIAFEATTGIAALVAQAWTLTTYAKIVSSPNAPNSLALVITERNSAGSGLIEGTSTIVPTSSLQRFTFTRTNTAATCAFVEPLISFALTSGATYDFTIRIAAPQMELGAYATTFIPTTTAAVTRLGDSTFKAGLSSLFGTEGTWFIEMSPSSIGVSTTAFKKVIGLFQVNGSISDCIYLEEYIGTWGVFVRKGNTTIVSRAYGTQPRKLAVTFGATGSRIYIDGVQAASTATNTSISPVQISTTQTSGSAIETVLNISQMAYFPTPLTQAQLAQITTL